MILINVVSKIGFTVRLDDKNMVWTRGYPYARLSLWPRTLVSVFGFGLMSTYSFLSPPPPLLIHEETQLTTFSLLSLKLLVSVSVLRGNGKESKKMLNLKFVSHSIFNKLPFV